MKNKQEKISSANFIYLFLTTPTTLTTNTSLATTLWKASDLFAANLTFLLLIDKFFRAIVISSAFAASISRIET